MYENHDLNVSSMKIKHVGLRHEGSNKPTARHTDKYISPNGLFRFSTLTALSNSRYLIPKQEIEQGHNTQMPPSYPKSTESRLIFLLSYRHTTSKSPQLASEREAKQKQGKITEQR